MFSLMVVLLVCLLFASMYQGAWIKGWGSYPWKMEKGKVPSSCQLLLSSSFCSNVGMLGELLWWLFCLLSSSLGNPKAIRAVPRGHSIGMMYFEWSKLEIFTLKFSSICCHFYSIKCYLFGFLTICISWQFLYNCFLACLCLTIWLGLYCCWRMIQLLFSRFELSRRWSPGCRWCSLPVLSWSGMQRQSSSLQ